MNSLTDQGFQILRTAVNLAKQEKIQSLGQLTERLNKAYPDCENDINSALKLWATHEQNQN
jgi:hypothetical protein